MTSQYAGELCALLIEDNFGELFARIFSTLHRHDRLALPRLKFHSRLTDRQLHHGLAAMIQHHLVYHYTSLDDGATYYEANLQSAYYLIRSGKILELIENRLGKYAANVMSTIMFLGHAQISYLETLPELRPQETTINGIGDSHEENGDYEENGENGQNENGEHQEHPNGLNGEHASSEQPDLLHPTLKALAAHGYIIRVREAQLQSHADNFLDAEKVISSKPDVKSMKGKKFEETVKLGAVELIRERTNGDLTRGLISHDGLPRGAKRKFGSRSDGTSNKKSRTDHAAIDEDGDDEEEENEWSDDEMGYDTVPMESALVIRVNYAKLDVALRNSRFVELAEQDSSSVTAHVYDCLLRRIEYQTPRCRDPIEDPVEIPREGEENKQFSVGIALSKLAEDVDPRLDLAGSIGPMDISQAVNKRGKRPLDDGINGGNYEGSNGLSSGANRTYEVDQHLSLLAQPPYNFTSRLLIDGRPNWKVEFRHLTRKLRNLELERMIEARYGDVALRVIRVLHAKGKLDEKRLQEISLLPFKDLRQVLASMQAGGFVDLQEVPRDAQRQPSRTIYLWYYDPDRIRSSVIEACYKAMSKCMNRMKAERNRLKEFLEKTERSDVKGNEERYLSEGELETLRQWKAKEAMFLGEVARLDDMVAVMRDY